MVYIPKRGCVNEAIELAKAEKARTDATNVRVSSCWYGHRGAIAIESEHENLEEMQKFWDDWTEQPEAAEFSKKWVELLESGDTNEIWVLH